MVKFSVARARLLATVSAGALVAASPAWAQQVSYPSGFWMSAEGDFFTAAGTKQQLLSPRTGPTDLLGTVASRARAEWGVELAGGGPLPSFFAMPGWDFRLAYTGIRSGNSRSTKSATSISGYNLESLTSDIHQRFDIGDFDIGRDFGLGPVPLHAFAGGRFVAFNQADSDEGSGETLGGEGEHMCSHYFGAGPRIGLDSKYPIDREGPFTLSAVGEVAGSVLFGSSSLKATYTDDGVTTPETTSHSSYQPVYNFDASVGVALSFPLYGTEGTFTAGYRGEAWWHILDTETQDFALAGTSGTRNGNQFLYGPFLRFALKL